MSDSSSTSSSQSSELEAIVLDNGSGRCRAGFAGDDAPMSVFSSIIGTPRYGKSMIVAESTFIGDKAQKLRGILSLDYPIEHGIVTNWDHMEKIWEYIAEHELRVEFQNYKLVTSEVPLNPLANREKLAHIMFETFNVPFMIVDYTGKLSLYSSGRGTGLVLDSGDGVTTTFPVYEGHCPRTAVKRIDFGGRDLTHYLMHLLSINKIHDFTTTCDREIAREVKEQLCCVSEASCDQLYAKDFTEKTYTLPDGQSFTLGKERFLCGEALFKPSMCDLKFPGIHTLIHESLMECDLDTRRDFYSNVIVNGGNTMIPGFSSRLASELTELIPKTMKCKVVSPPERLYSVWIGGSIVGSLTTTRFVSRQDYEEYGPSILLKRMP